MSLCLISRDDKILVHPHQGDFLSEIKSRFPKFNEQDRYPDGQDIAGIRPDLLIIPGAKSQGPNARVYLIENKPYDTFNPTGNQEAGGDYDRFVKWLNKSYVPCQYLLIQSIGMGWEDYKKVQDIQKGLPDHFGVLLLEDLFAEMQRCNFRYSPITDTEPWGGYTDKGQDYA
mgnify:CR=1 FL=1